MLVIGDVHGCYDTLIKLLDKIPTEHKEKICFAGDLIDRGPKSFEVVKFVKQNNYDCVRGNHEQMMVDAFAIQDFSLWTRNGGTTAIHSYKKNSLDEADFVLLTEDHIKWMKILPYFIEYKDVKTPDGRHLVVSHSLCHNYWNGLHSDQDHRVAAAQHHTIWNRIFHKVKDAGFYNVIGHTIQEQPKIKKIYANIDTGCFWGIPQYSQEKSYLTALHVESMTIYQQECIDVFE